jgi:hypothetical protein
MAAVCAQLGRGILIDLSKAGLTTERQQNPAHVASGVLGSRGGFDIASYHLCEGASSTPFAVPRRPEDFGFECGCLFGRELGVVALSAAANALAGDSARDGEGAS